MRERKTSRTVYSVAEALGLREREKTQPLRNPLTGQPYLNPRDAFDAESG